MALLVMMFNTWLAHVTSLFGNEREASSPLCESHTVKLLIQNSNKQQATRTILQEYVGVRRIAV